MTNAPPPFDPPYVSFCEDGNTLQCIETLADGTVRPVTLPNSSSHLRSLLVDTKPQAIKDLPVTSGTNTATKVKTPYSGQKAALYLEVPFAEKNDAKHLGAKWDASKRKWYVPNGIDTNLFAKWWRKAQ